jgi:hypothetical protein
MKPWRLEERKPWCLERSQGVRKGGPETKAGEYGRIERHYIPLQGIESSKEYMETRKENPGDKKKRKLLCLERSLENIKRKYWRPA